MDNKHQQRTQKWGMIVDVRKCVGCGTCKQVCDDANKVPPGATWRRLAEHQPEKNPKGLPVFVTMSCMHCNEPPCLKVCPTGATYRRPDGIVDINDKLCAGCGACVVACPYQARSITFEDKLTRAQRTRLQGITATNSDRIGVCTKCNFCLSRLDVGLSMGLRPGSDPEATPLCVRFCIAEALYFGDLDDPDSTVSELIRGNNTVRLQEDLETGPSVYYIVE